MRRRYSTTFIWFLAGWVACGLPLAVVALSPAASFAQGLLVDDRPDHRFRLPRPRIWPPPHPPGPRPPRPRPPRPEPPQAYKIQALEVHATLADQVAKVQVSQSFVNTGSRQMEVSFVFPLPYDGAVDRMTFMVDGREYPAKLLTADEARRIYQEHIRRNEDPALLEWMGTGMLKTSVFPVPAGAKRTVTMHYSQLSRTTQGLTEWLFPLSTAKYTSKAVEKVLIDATIESSEPLKNIYSPTHPAKIKRPTNKRAHITFSSENSVPTSDFRLMYDVGEQPVAANALSYRPRENEEGYFLLLVSPDIERSTDKPIPKTVMFVVDRSGSMSGKKIEQAKGALKFVLNNLNKSDLFNIVAYDSRVESFKPELQRYDSQTRAEALGFVEGIYAGGSTDIDEALQAALGQLRDETRPAYIVFLTDGLPTAGERRASRIVKNAADANQVRARVFTFGVGHDVNSRLLDKLARQGFGQSQYVRPEEDIEAHVARLYQRIGAPALVDVDVSWDLEGYPSEKGSPVSRVYPKGTFDLFAGEQLVVVGRYKQPGQAKITISGTVDQQKKSYDFPVELTESSSDGSQAFVEKLWALRRVGEIIDQIDLEGKNQELVNELVGLATKHGILTPYTSFLADETTDVRDVASNQTRTDQALDALRAESGSSAFGQRRVKNLFQRAESARMSGYGRAADTGRVAEAPPASTARGSVGGMGGGAPGLSADQSPRESSAPSRKARDTAGPTREARPQERSETEPTVLNVGTKTFFRRNGRWEDSALTDRQLQNVHKIKRYSQEYFELGQRFGKEVSQYLAIEGNVVVVLEGQAYEF
ncbi:MAG: VIT domain-containing protein [Planctomycetota bacterium]